MDIYRRCNVFERILAYYGSPAIKPSGKTKVQHLLYRGAQAGGSTTLITRFAGIAWIKMQICEVGIKEASILGALAQELYDTCDHDYIDQWSKGRMGDFVQGVMELLDQVLQPVNRPSFLS